MDKTDKLRSFIAALLACIGSAIDWVGWLIVILLACMVLDYLSGTWAAMSRGEWSSAVARQGLWHKLGEISALAVAVLCDLAIGQIAGSGAISLPFDYSVLATPLVAVWYIFTELGSIAENAAALGAPVPTWLGKMLSAVRRATENEAERQRSDDENTDK